MALSKYSAITVAVISSLYLSACGGGGGSGATPNPGSGTTPTNPTTPTAPTWIAGQYAAETQFKDFCASPRTGIDPFTNAAYPDKAGTSMHEKMWLRSWSNNTYLWYRELPDPDPISYSVSNYFGLLKTTAKTDSGADKDNFHFSQNTADYKKETESGVRSGYGIKWIFGSVTPPRNLQIAYSEPSSPAAAQNVGRGYRLVEIDGVDFVNDNSQAGVDKINAALFPSQNGRSHQFTFVDPQGNRRSVTLVSADVTSSPVQNVKILNTIAGKVGYMQFNTHIANAQPQLIDAITQFRDGNVNELVVDLRYNGGGLLALASQLGYMVAGPNVIQGRIFERTLFNDKHPTINPVTGSVLQPVPFYSQGIDYQAGRFTGVTLPHVSLRRVFVLTTDNTCSASEAFINGLRGVDLEVILVGGTTCGKPYGFYPTDNCGTTYFTVQFSGVNAKNFGEFSDGFRPAASPQFASDVKGCPVADDLSKPLGDPSEKMLNTALHYMTNNSCPAVAVAQQSVLADLMADAAQAPLPNGLAIRSFDPKREAMILENKLQQPILPAEQP